MIHTQKALEILGVKRLTLQRYIADGKIRVLEKRVDGNYFDEDEILSILPTMKKKQLTHAPDAIEKKIKKQKEVEAKGKEIEKKLKDADDKPKDELLDDNGKQHLIELKTHMEELGIYEKIDDQLIFTASLAFQTFLKYEALAASLDYMTMDARGVEKEHPYSDIAKKHFDRYLNVCERLGITPVARKKMKPQNDKPLNDFSQFIL